MRFGEVLEGYAIDQLQPMLHDSNGGFVKRRPVGNTGLTVRILQIAYNWAVLASLRRHHIWNQGHIKFAPVFATFHSSVSAEWMMELLRIMDKAESRVGNQTKANLTVNLCHDLFQQDQGIDNPSRAMEKQRFETLKSSYDALNLRDLRNWEVFHLDYATVSTQPKPIGDISNITTDLVDWFLCVAPIHYKGHQIESDTETVKRRGKLTAKHFRRMLFTYYRAESGIRCRRKTSVENLRDFSHMRVGINPLDPRL